MKKGILTSLLLVLGISISSFGFIHPVPSTKSAVNRDIVITNLMSGVNSGNQGLRMSSTYFLGELKSDEAVIPLMRMLKSDKNEEARIMSALSLSKIGDSRGVYAVKQAIKFDSSERVKKMCSNFYHDYLSKE